MAKKTTKGEIINRIIRLSCKLNKVPTRREFQKEGGFNQRAMVREFKTYNNLLSEAGLIPNNIKNYYTDEELLMALLTFKKEYGRNPTYQDFQKNKEYPNPCNYQRRFGKFNNALKLVGFSLRQRYYTTEQLLDLLKKRASEIGCSPKKEEMYYSKIGYPNFSVYQDRFGSWTNALTAAGLELNTKPLYLSDKEMLEGLSKFAEKLGRTPTTLDIDLNPELPHSTTYNERFGSYFEVLSRLNLKPNLGCFSQIWYDWQEHCENMAIALYRTIIRQDKIDGGYPDIFVPHYHKIIDAKTCGYDYFQYQIDRYTKENKLVEFWCIHKGIENKSNPNVTYYYAEELAGLMKQIGRQDLANKCYLFKNNAYSEEQQELVVQE